MWQLTLYWRASDDAPTDFSRTVFVHLLVPDGRLCVQHDSLPQNFERLTTIWLPSEIIANSHNLQPPTCNSECTNLRLWSDFLSITVRAGDCRTTLSCCPSGEARRRELNDD